MGGEIDPLTARRLVRLDNQSAEVRGRTGDVGHIVAQPRGVRICKDSLQIQLNCVRRSI